MRRGGKGPLGSSPGGALQTGIAPRQRGETRVLPTRKKRGDGLERRPPVGIARERETSSDDAAPCERTLRTPAAPEQWSIRAEQWSKSEFRLFLPEFWEISGFRLGTQRGR